MPLVKIVFPQVGYDLIEVEVTSEQMEEMKDMRNNEKADFTEKHLGENELGLIPGPLESAFEYGYARFIYP